MKDDTIANIESSLPSLDGDAAIEHCLQALYDDQTHCMADEFAPHVTYRELIDGLLAAREAVDIVREFLAETANDDFLDTYDEEDDWGDLDDDWDFYDD